MENQTQIILQSINEISENSNVSIIVYDPLTTKRAQHYFSFVSNRVASNQVTVGQNLNVSLSNLVSAINLDTPLLFSAAMQNSNAIGISILNPSLQVSDVTSFNPILSQPIFESQIIVNPIQTFEITSVTFLPADFVTCSQVKVRVQTSQSMTSYCRGLSCSSINNNIIEFTAIRNTNIVFKAIRNSITKTRTINTPSLLIEPEITVFNTPFGASVTAIIQNFGGLDIQYSLDNLNWQDSNVFSGLDVGNYTVYVKDQLGCSKSKNFSVLENSFGVKPNVFISKENSFRFKEPNSNYLTDENQYFNQSTNAINYCFTQEFLNSDIITTQFKSNYQDIEVYVTDLNTSEVFQIGVSKMTNNIGLKQKLSEVRKYKINNFQFGIYFESGNVLNYDTDIPIESYSLNGTLPIWAKLGNYISINGAYYQISSIGFDENVNSEVLIFDGFMSGLSETVVVSSIYSLQEYEIYEFDLNFNLFSNTEIEIEIRNSDPNFDGFSWISERVRSNQSLKNHLEIRYSNLTNTNVVYSTGIEHLLRIPFNKIKAVDSDTSENYNTDTNTYLLSSKVYEITEFDLMPLPLELWRKVKIALSVDTIFIDGVGYSKNAEFTKEPLGSSNLYKVTAQLIKTGFVFNSNIDSNEILIENPIVNIPGLIESDSGGFIEY